MNYYISDLHLGHENCLDFDNRPFSSIEAQDEVIIHRWNCNVDIDDDVYILGDLSFYNATKTKEIIEQLNGNKHFIVGNHDNRFLRNENIRKCFVEITHYKELVIDEKNNISVVLQHYPIFAYKNLYRGWKHLYGHVHNSFEWNMMERHKWQVKDLYSKKDGTDPKDIYCAYNVGCMLSHMDYTPRTLEYIEEHYPTTICMDIETINKKAKK